MKQNENLLTTSISTADYDDIMDYLREHYVDNKWKLEGRDKDKRDMQNLGKLIYRLEEK